MRDDGRVGRAKGKEDTRLWLILQLSAPGSPRAGLHGPDAAIGGCEGKRGGTAPTHWDPASQDLF